MHNGRPAQLDLARFWLALCAFVTVALIFAARIKGGYIDEYYTFSFADSTVPLKKAFEGWSRDRGHPVGFYALSRVGDLLLAPDLFLRRLTNLVYFAAAILVAWCAGKAHRAFGLLYLSTLAASPYVIERFAEYRSTFLGLMIIAMLVIRLRAAVDGPITRAAVLSIAALSALLGIVDYPHAITGLGLCAALAIVGLRQRNFNFVQLAALAGAACGLTLGASLINGARFHQFANPYFESSSALARDLLIVTATAVAPCLAMCGLALIALRRARASIMKAALGTTFAQLLLLALIITTVGLFLVNGETHLLIRRQIFGIIPLVVAYLTEASLPYLQARPITVALIAINLLVVAIGGVVALKSKRNFDRYGPEIVQARRSCATLPVYAILPEKIIHRHDNRYRMPDQVAKGFEDVARRYGFQIHEDVPKGHWMDPVCGAVLWSEALWLDRPPSAESIASTLGLNIEPAALRSTKVEWADQESRRQYSMLMRVPAASH